jgi:hypothetical protein
MSKFFKLILKSKFIFGNTNKFDIIIFDCEGKDAIEALIFKKKFKVLSVRYEKISEIYANVKILNFIFNNLFKYSLKQLYLIALIKCFSPKIIITQIPHSIEFSVLAKHFEKDIKFIALQHGHHDIYSLEKKLKKKIYIPDFFCFSDYEKNLYGKNNDVKIKNFSPVGSLRASLSKEYSDKKKENLKLKYDICLISEYSPSNKKLFPGTDGLQLIPSYPDHVGKIAYFCHKLRDEENLNLIFCGDAGPNTIYQNIENDFYSKFLKGFKFEILQKERDTFPTYINLLKSKIVIGGYSTILREALGLRKKILSCNFTENSILDFPLDEICLFKKNNYSEFKNVVMKILSMNDDEYFKKINSNKDFIMKDCYKTANLVRDKLDSYLI